MRLLLDTLRALFTTSLRFCALLLVLFGIHLLLSRAWPELKRTAALLQEEPRISAELERLGAKLDREQKDAATLELRLKETTEAHLTLLQASVDRWHRRIEELREQEQNLARQLADITAERKKYCDTWNPIKLWFCHEVEARTAELRAALMPLVDGVSQSLAEGESGLSAAQRQLDRLNRGDTRALGPVGASLARQIEASRQRARALSDELQDAQKRRARVAQAIHSPLGWIVREWRTVWLRLVLIVLAVALFPYIQRTLAYWVFMPLAEHARALRLTEPRAQARLRASSAQRSLTIALAPGESLSVRAGYARPVEGRATSQLLYRWSAPFVSYAAGLSLLTRLDPDPSGKRATSVTLSSPEAAHSYLMRVDLDDHPGVVFHPRQLVGVMGDVDLRTVWRIFSWHAWATGQLRYILLSGTGGCILEGHGDIVANTLTQSRAKIEQHLVVGFDTRLDYKTARTETFLPYLFGKTPLVDDVFEGTGSYFWQKGPNGRAASVVERSLDVLFGAIGKLLGF
jgi:hypothetical protein